MKDQLVRAILSITTWSQELSALVVLLKTTAGEEVDDREAHEDLVGFFPPPEIRSQSLGTEGVSGAERETGGKGRREG